MGNSRGYQRPQGRSVRQDEDEIELEDVDDDIENHKDWHHYHSYKERRDIFEQLQAIQSL